MAARIRPGGPGSIPVASGRGEQDGTERVDAFLRSLGATDEQIGIARDERHIAGLAGDLVLAEGASLTAVDWPARAGSTVEAVLGTSGGPWAWWSPTGPGRCSPSGTSEFTSYIGGLNPVGAHGDELLRVLGNSLARVAEAAVSVYVQTVQPALDVPEIDLVVWAQELAAAIGAALQLGDSMGVIFAHHMRDAIDRQRVAQTGVSDRSLYRLAVGFVDLVGFTPLSLHTAPAELLELISTFESRGLRGGVRHDGRIVKHIGDEVMFVALDAATAVPSPGTSPRRMPRASSPAAGSPSAR